MEERISDMKSKIKYIVIGLLIVLTIGFSTYYYGKSKAEKEVVYKEIKVYETQIAKEEKEVSKIEDKVVKKTKERKQLQEKEKTIDYPKEDCKEIVDNLKEQLENCDSIVVYKDNIIEKERIIIEYKDKIIEKMVIPKPKPWGIGIQAGYGTDGKEFFPTVSVGVSYNILRF